MKIWFTRSNGDTPLNNPNSLDFVPGEPPLFPKKDYDYREKCLNDGFARIGWPNVGELDNNFSSRLAPDGYSVHSIETKHQNYLMGFKSIKAGDLVLIPAISGQSSVHLGIVLTKSRELVLPYLEPRPPAYFYYFDLKRGDWYECAHRVNVKWAKDEFGDYSTFKIKAIKFNIWRIAFSPVEDDGSIFHLAQESGLF